MTTFCAFIGNDAGASAGRDPIPCASEWRGWADLVSAIGEPGFAHRALLQVRAWLPVGSWSAYQVWPDRPPVMHASAILQGRDTTQDCFAAYRDGLYRRDSSFDAVRRGRTPGAALLRMQADDAPSAEHRDRIYRRHGVLERVSLAQSEPDGSVLAVNFYRHDTAGGRPFSEGEVAGLARVAPLLLATVQRHIGWQAAAATAATPPRPGLRQRLGAACPALTARELDVCVRLLGGMSYDGIAADMGVSTATVKTYRARAFDRLGLHFKSELYARFLQ